MEKLKTFWSQIPLMFKAIIITLTVLFIVSIITNWNTYRGKTEALKELEKENLILKIELKEQQEITDVYRKAADTLMLNRQNFNLEELEQGIKNKYNEKRNNTLNQPIDSTISDLSKWLKE